MEQIKTEIGKRKGLPEDRTDSVSRATAKVVSGEGSGEKGDENATASVQQSQDEIILDDRTESSDKEIPKLAQVKRRIIIKRSSLRKNAELESFSAVSAEKNSSTLESNDQMTPKVVSLSPAPSKSSACATEPVSSHAQDVPFFDATCIDRSVGVGGKLCRHNFRYV